jgi:hypothetical protein
MARRDGFYYSAAIYGARRLKIAVKERIKAVGNLLFNFILLSYWLATLSELFDGALA